MVWYSQFFRSFPQFVVIHTVKGFSVVYETDTDIFLEFFCFSYDSMDIGNGQRSINLKVEVFPLSQSQVCSGPGSFLSWKPPGVGECPVLLSPYHPLQGES